MASTAATAACALMPSAFVERRAATSLHCVGLPSMPLPSKSTIARRRGSWRSTSYCCKIARNVVAMAVGDATAEVSTVAVEDAPDEVVTLPVGDAQVQASTEMPEIVKNIIDTWDKIEDKYAATSLGVAGFIGLWGAAGMISAIDKLPLVPGALEVVGIGYSGWFAYKNLIFKPDRDALIAKIKSAYEEIIGSS